MLTITQIIRQEIDFATDLLLLSRMELFAKMSTYKGSQTTRLDIELVGNHLFAPLSRFQSKTKIRKRAFSYRYSLIA